MRVLNNLLDDGRMNRLLEQETMAKSKGDVYTLVKMLDDVRHGVWSELSSSSPVIDGYRRELQMDYLSAIDRKINPAEVSSSANAAPRFGPPPIPLSDDAKSELRGELGGLRGEVQRAAARAGDRETQLHLQGAVQRIDMILDPNK
jgi:hypothetical protein